jgi:hypothetical protein
MSHCAHEAALKGPEGIHQSVPHGCPIDRAEREHSPQSRGPRRHKSLRQAKCVLCSASGHSQHYSSSREGVDSDAIGSVLLEECIK